MQPPSVQRGIGFAFLRAAYNAAPVRGFTEVHFRISALTNKIMQEPTITQGFTAPETNTTKQSIDPIVADFYWNFDVAQEV